MQPDVCEILHVDKANRTLYLNVNGCMVTAICAEQRDDELCRQIYSLKVPIFRDCLCREI